VQLVLPGEAHRPEELGAVAVDDLLALARRRLGHHRRPVPARVVLGDRQGRVVGEHPRPLDRQVHVGRLVLDRLERADRDAELMALLHVRHHQVEDPAAGADRGHRQPHQGQIGHARHQAGVPGAGRGHVGDVQPQVERVQPLGRHLGPAHHHDPVAGQQRHLVGPVRVEDESPGPVEHPGPRPLGQPPRQRREPGGGGEERGRVGDVAELVEHDRQLDRRGLQPAEGGVGRPELVGGQRAGLGQGLADRLPEQQLILVELELHGQPPGRDARRGICRPSRRENLP
jgi:hypothetical protein